MSDIRVVKKTVSVGQSSCAVSPRPLVSPVPTIHRERTQQSQHPDESVQVTLNRQTEPLQDEFVSDEFGESDSYHETSLTQESISDSFPDVDARLSTESPRQLFRERLSLWRFSFASSFSFLSKIFSGVFGNRRIILTSFFGILLLGGVWLGIGLFEKGMKMKGEVLGVSTEGYGELSQAVETAKTKNFAESNQLFQEAFISFSAASDLFDSWNGTVIETARFLPLVSKLSSGKYLVDAARDISAAGESISKVGGSIFSLGNPLAGNQNISFLSVFRETRGTIEHAEALLSSALENLDKVSISDLPEDKRDQFLGLKTKLPEVLSGMRIFLAHGDVFADILGGNGPRKFLFLFENNQEMRATGGFIGSYAFLDMNDGRVRKFFVDGIFNPDGQLHTNIVPPEPIQKISAGWSLHDSNWFPDFPVSAEKAISFYEKTGGPTVDGVIAFTPEILRKFLAITGPIRMEDYGVTVDEDNFLETIQYQVEVAYDREVNKPKQILSDLAPILLERIFGEGAPPGAFGKALSAVESGLSEKQMLFYSRNSDMERLIRNVGWSGEMLSVDCDYLSVIHSNINGYKTDGVVNEAITHRAEIKDDGSVVDTVSVKRTHTGGHTGREWWDRVNADYMRIYVPLGSTLLSAEGYTRETVDPPLDYDALHFSRDQDVERERLGMHIDPASGTRISDDAGKTVFGNWVYVSPGESVEVSYTYLLPFHIDPSQTENSLDSYSIVFQKQSGSRGSLLDSEIAFPERFQNVWQSEGNLVPFERDVHLQTDLSYDRFIGLLFSNQKR
ncbi:MAG: DUF4012 domain-containing protein [Candidatus Moraniibacteriota bacterium]